MQLAIAQNPFVQDPAALWDKLTPASLRKDTSKHDDAGFAALKAMMSRPGSKIIVK